MFGRHFLRAGFAVAMAAALLGAGCKPRRPATRFDELIAELSGGRRAQRLEAMDALTGLGDKRAIGPLLALYRDPKEEGIIREMALVSVAELGDSHVFAYAMEQLPAALLRKDEFGVRPYMLGKAVLTSGTQSLAPVIDLSRSQDSSTSIWAIDTLGHFRGDRRALTALLALAKTPDPSTREAVISSLGQQFNAEAAPAIQAALSDPDPGVRDTANFAWKQLKLLMEVQRQQPETRAP